MERSVVRDGDPPGTRQEATRWPSVVTAGDRHRQHRGGERRRETEGARLETLDATVGASLALGEDHHHLPGLEEPDGLARRPRVGRLNLDGKRAEQTDEWPEEGDLEETAPCHVVDAPTDRNPNEPRISARLGVCRDHQRAPPPEGLNPAPPRLRRSPARFTSRP